MPENTENISRGTSVNVQSIKDKLKNVAKVNSRLYQELLTVFALERSLYRIGKSKYRENFTLKGGIFLYALYDKEYPRSTSDIDLRADKISGTQESLLSIFSEIGLAWKHKVTGVN